MIEQFYDWGISDNGSDSQFLFTAAVDKTKVILLNANVLQEQGT